MKEKCLIIMPMSEKGKYPEKHFEHVYEQIIKPAVESEGYEAYRVDDDKISNSIIAKIFKAAQTCPMAVCDLSDQNPNVLYELGLRQAYDKPVVLIKDDITKEIFDVSGINTMEYRSDRVYENVEADREKLKQAIKATKAGEAYSIAQIARVESVAIVSDNVGTDETIGILLKSILKDIKELKKNVTEGNPKLDKNVDRESMLFEYDLSKNSGYGGIVKVKLNPEVTEREIMDSTVGQLESVEEVSNWTLDYDNRKFYVYIKEGYMATHLKNICNILEKIGSVSY